MARRSRTYFTDKQKTDIWVRWERGEHKPTVIGDSGDINEMRRQLVGLELDTKIQEEWLSHVRVNFTLNDRV